MSNRAVVLSKTLIRAEYAEMLGQEPLDGEPADVVADIESRRNVYRSELEEQMETDDSAMVWWSDEQITERIDSLLLEAWVEAMTPDEVLDVIQYRLDLFVQATVEIVAFLDIVAMRHPGLVDAVAQAKAEIGAKIEQIFVPDGI